MCLQSTCPSQWEYWGSLLWSSPQISWLRPQCKNLVKCKILWEPTEGSLNVRCEGEEPRPDTQPYFVSGEEIELFDFLTSNYDVRKRPGPPQQAAPLEILNSLYVYFIGNFEAQHLEFETHLLFRHKWKVEETLKQKHNTKLSFPWKLSRTPGWSFWTSPGGSWRSKARTGSRPTSGPPTSS